LGHTSLLNAFLLSSDEKYIITADRDEHIRVSWYPQGYNIEMYCLGHKKFVHCSLATPAPGERLDRFISAIYNPGFAPSELISGGGDPVLKIWDWMTGITKHEFPVLDAIQPYIKVRSKRGKRGDDANDGTDVGRRKGKKKKGKGNATNGGAIHADTTNGCTEESPRLDTNVSPEMVPDDVHQQGSGEQGEQILVVHRISTVASETGNYIIFNAVGYVVMQLQ
jgi:tRNA (guanine-N(7)-)-methyltransferase subunit TRM82